MTCAGEPITALEDSQALGTYHCSQRADAHVVGIEGVVGRSQPQGSALIEETQGQLRQGPHAKAQTDVGADLVDRHSLGADLLGDPLGKGRVRVIGKGQKEREVPLPADVVGELARYLVSRGLDADPEDIGNQGACLLGKASDAAERAPGLSTGQMLDPRQGIAATTFYDQIKRFFEDCAGVLRGQGDAKGAERLAKASTHWMRHSHASHAIASGMPIEIAQQNLGHASLATTTVYVTTEKRRRMKAVEAFWKR